MFGTATHDNANVVNVAAVAAAAAAYTVVVVVVGEQRDGTIDNVGGLAVLREKEEENEKEAKTASRCW